jgi:hypothetical protein
VLCNADSQLIHEVGRRGFARHPLQHVYGPAQDTHFLPTDGTDLEVSFHSLTFAQQQLALKVLREDVSQVYVFSHCFCSYSYGRKSWWRRGRSGNVCLFPLMKFDDQNR